MKILAYDDNPGFGGHQIMACQGLRALAAEPSVDLVCMVRPGNQLLAKALSPLPILPADPFRIRNIQPDKVLCIQGDIGQSKRGVKASVHAGIECISYIAIPHPLAEMGAKLGAIRDWLNRPFLNMPDRFITISGTMRDILVDRGCAKPVSIVPNGIPKPQTTNHKPQAEHPVIGVVGRIEFKQKQQDAMLKAFLEQTETFKDCRLLFVGGGPDEDKLNAMVRKHATISCLPWQNDVEAIFQQIDVLAIPSRYEGVPLVMLEALVRGIPAIGSARDGMKEMLPSDWTFEPGDAKGIADAFEKVRAHGKDHTEVLRAKMLAEHSLEAFNANFTAAILQS